VEINKLQPNGQAAWIESMYWDCIFLADIYEKDVTSSLNANNIDNNPFAGLSYALRYGLKLLSDVKDEAEKVDSKIDDIDNKLKTAIPVIGDYCAHHKCPDVLPRLIPRVTPEPVRTFTDICDHNWCP
jgi:hypothetical protein